MKYSWILMVLIFCGVVWGGVSFYSYEQFIDNLFLEAGGETRGMKIYMEAVNLVFKILGSQSDDQTRIMLKQIIPLLQKYEFEKLYHSPLLKPLQNNFYGVAFEGRPDIRFYQINTTSLAFKQINLKSFGDFAAEFSLKPDPLRKSFLFNSKLKASTNHFTYRTLDVFIEHILRILDPHNIKIMQGTESSSFHYLSGPSRKVINQLAQTFPLNTSFVDRYIRIQSIAHLKSYAETPFTHIAFKFTINYDTIKQDYPHINIYLQKMKSLLQRVHIKFINPKGHLLASIVINGKEDYISIDVFTKSGQLIPFTNQGQPILEDAFYLKEKEILLYYIDLKVYLQLYGLVFCMDQFRLKVNRDSKGPFKDTIVFKLNTRPQTKVFDSGIHLVPGWVVKLLTPDALINKINSTINMIYKGMQLEISWTLPQQYVSITNCKFSFESPNDFYAVFGFGLLQNKLLPDMPALQEFREAIVKFISEFIRDMFPMIINKVPDNEDQPL